MGFPRPSDASEISRMCLNLIALVHSACDKSGCNEVSGGCYDTELYVITCPWLHVGSDNSKTKALFRSLQSFVLLACCYYDACAWLMSIQSWNPTHSNTTDAEATNRHMQTEKHRHACARVGCCILWKHMKMHGSHLHI